MFNKNFLIEKIVKKLIEKEFQVLVNDGCFDVAAKRDELLLIKSLINIDSLGQQQAMSLRSISYFLSAHPLVVSVKNNRQFLSDEVVYSRFDVPVFTPTSFEEYIDEDEIPSVKASRGRHVAEIDSELLRHKRKERGFSLSELANIIGISKKAMYEIEKRRVNPSVESIQRLETVLRIELKTRVNLGKAEPTYLKPQSDLQEKVSKEFNRMGIDNSPVYSAPFEIVGRSNYSLITGLSRNLNKIRREAGKVHKFSRIFSSKAMFVAKKTREKVIEGVPIILESELSGIGNSKELREVIEEKRENH